jgi:transcriptional regulator with XRE-family HTH domain
MKRMTLREAREQKGWTQEQLEDVSGVSQSTIVRLETSPDANPTVSVLQRLEKALGLKRGALMVGREVAA